MVTSNSAVVEVGGSAAVGVQVQQTALLRQSGGSSIRFNERADGTFGIILTKERLAELSALLVNGKDRISIKVNPSVTQATGSNGAYRYLDGKVTSWDSIILKK